MLGKVKFLVLLALLSSLLSINQVSAANQQPSNVLDDQVFFAYGPSGQELDQVLANHYPEWASYKQSVSWSSEPVTVGKIVREASFQEQFALNSAVTLITLGESLDWQLPPNDDLFSQSLLIGETLNHLWSEWTNPENKQIRAQFPEVTNGATYALYVFFDYDTARLQAWQNSYQTFFGNYQFPSVMSVPAEAGATDIEPFLARPFLNPDASFYVVNSFFDHEYPRYAGEGSGNLDTLYRFDGVRLQNAAFDPCELQYNCYSGHDGYDYNTPLGRKILAPAAGIVIDTLDSTGTVIIGHDNGLYSYAMHLDTMSVIKDQHVEQGDEIGGAGSRGTGGVHLHFGVRYPDNVEKDLDPFGWWSTDPDPWAAFPTLGQESTWLWKGDEAGDGYLTVDNRESQAQLFREPATTPPAPPEIGWHRLASGYQNEAWYTFMNQNTDTAAYWGIWGTTIEQAGEHTVQAYWPDDPDPNDEWLPSSNAKYTLYFRENGVLRKETLYGNQTLGANRFNPLCKVEHSTGDCPEGQRARFTFDQGPTVLFLSNPAQYDTSQHHRILFFDAIQWQQYEVRDIAFVIDTTGSMGDEINIVKSTTSGLVDVFVQKGISPKYHLVTYKDFPYVDYVGGTTDAPTIKGWLNSLSASGGGDCPEEMLGALELTAQNAPKSEAMVLTDASFHGGPPEIAATAAKLNAADVKVHIISYGNCGTFAASSAIEGQDSTQNNSKNQLSQPAGEATLLSGTSDPFAQISSETGGHYFRIVTSETDEATTILLNEMITSSDLVQYTDEVTSTSPRTYNVSIDSTITKANFLLNMVSGTGSLTLINPSGITVNPTDPGVTYTAVTNAKYYQITDPMVGVWQVQVSGSGTFTLSTSGNSSINFAYLSDTSLAKNVTVNLLASLSGSVSSSSFQFIYPDGTLLQTVSLFDDGLHGDGLAGDGTYGGAYTPTTVGSFQFRVTGTTTSGTGFQRIATATIRVQTVSVIAPADQTAAPGTGKVYDFAITNGGTSNETYDLVITSSQGWADLSGVPTSISVAAGATGHILVPVNVPITATDGTTDELVLSAVSQADPLMHDSDSVRTTVGGDLIFKDGFESGDFSAWYWATTDGGDLSVSTKVAAVGTKSMQALIDDNNEIILYDHTPNSEKHFSARFYFDPNSVQMPYNQGFYIFAGSDATSWVFCLNLEKEGANYTLALCGHDDSEAWLHSAPVMIPDAWQAVEVEWKAATGPGTNDGYLKLWINDTLVKTITKIDNDTRTISKTSLGVTDIHTGTSGTMYFDAFESHQGSHIGLDPGGPALPPPPQPGDSIFADNFDSGNLSLWSSTVTDGGNLSVVSTAAYQKSAYGLKALINDLNNLRAIDGSPLAETHYRARFYFHPNSITMTSGNAHYIFDGIKMSSGDAVVRIDIIRESGVYKLRARIMNDAYSYVTTSKFTISNGWHAVEIEWQASSSSGKNDGFLTLWIDGALKQTLTAVDNDTHTIGEVRLGAVAGIDTGTSGSMYFDKFESRRNTYIGP